MNHLRITADAWLTDEGRDRADPNKVYVEYRIGDDWNVRLAAALYATVSGPVELEIKVAGADRMDDSASEGITTHVLRAIPMKDARGRLGRLMTEAYGESGDIRPLPHRFTEPADFALLASLYVDRLELGDVNPIRTLATQHQVSRNTLSARIRSARSQGLLAPEPEPAKLTARAHALLKELGDR